jgi:hypothetical protein
MISIRYRIDLTGKSGDESTKLGQSGLFYSLHYL